MKLALALVLATTALAAPAAAYDLIQNGGFETASLANWQIFNQGASGGIGSWYAKSSGNGIYSGLPTSPPPAGSWQAVADNNGRVAAILYQDVAIPATTKATLSFTLWLGNAAPGGAYTNGSSLSPSITNQRVRVDVIPTSLNLLTTTGALQLVYQTQASTPQIVNPLTVTADVTALAGQTVRLRYALVATQGGLITGIDQVKLEVSPFSIHPAPLSAHPSGGDMHWGDFDGDGGYELARTGIVSGLPYTWIERFGGVTWGIVANLPGASRQIAPGDVDADGDLDLGIQGVFESGSYEVGVMKNQGSYAFTPAYEYFGAAGGTIAWGDSDSDGDLDALLTGLFNGYPITIVGHNDRTGHLTPWVTNLRDIGNGHAIWANVNASGIRDVVLTGEGGAGFYAGDGDGFYNLAYSGFIDIASGDVAMGDLNNDGVDEMVIAGRRLSDNARVTTIYGFGIFGWLPSMGGLVGVDEASVSIGDFDNDGLSDIALMGMSDGGAITRVYRNNDGSFSDIVATLPAVRNGALRFGDFDGDGDLDLFVQGDGVSTPQSYLAINSTPAVNLAPDPPSSLSSSLMETEILLFANFPGSDDRTWYPALTQNFRAGTSSGAIDLIPPMSHLGNGKRMVARQGEAGHSATARLAINRIGHHEDVWWSMQAIDQSYLGSSWASEQRFVIGPMITSIADVPNDQGGHVRLTVAKCPLDDEARATWPAAGYNVWRLVPPAVAAVVARQGVAVAAAPRERLAAAAARGDETAAAPELKMRALSVMGVGSDLPVVEWDGRLFVQSGGPSVDVSSPFPAGTWEIVASWFALQQSSYVVATTTVADSGAGGPNNQPFLVTCHTTTPSVWFASLSQMGHSVDNLAPAAPAGLSAAYHTGSGNHLAWQPAVESDFEAYRIYRGSSPGFVAGPENLVTSVPSPSWTDPEYDLATVFYRVSTRDHAGNESAAVAPSSTTAVEEGAGSALTFALEAPSPNPFGSATRVAFTLPRESNVRVEVFDAGGRRVRTLVDGWRAAGEHSVRWAGEDDRGGQVGAGVYFCRIEAGQFAATRRVARMP